MTGAGAGAEFFVCDVFVAALPYVDCSVAHACGGKAKEGVRCWVVDSVCWGEREALSRVRMWVAF